MLYQETVILSEFVFFQNPTFLFIKIPRERNWAWNKTPTCGNSALGQISFSGDLAEGFARKLDCLHPSLKGSPQKNKINLE